MVFSRSLASAAGIVALLAAGCADEGAGTEPTAPSSLTITESTGPQQNPSARTAQPTKTVTVPTASPRPTKPTGPGSEYDVTCTGGPDEGTICTNPNHGAGDDPHGTGTAVPTTTKPR